MPGGDAIDGSPAAVIELEPQGPVSTEGAFASAVGVERPEKLRKLVEDRDDPGGVVVLKRRWARGVGVPPQTS
jgi:hypothetical protein